MNPLRSSPLSFFAPASALQVFILLCWPSFLAPRHSFMNALRSSPFLPTALLLHMAIRACWGVLSPSAARAGADARPKARVTAALRVKLSPRRRAAVGFFMVFLKIVGALGQEFHSSDSSIQRGQLQSCALDPVGRTSIRTDIGTGIRAGIGTSIRTGIRKIQRDATLKIGACSL